LGAKTSKDLFRGEVRAKLRIAQGDRDCILDELLFPKKSRTAFELCGKSEMRSEGETGQETNLMISVAGGEPPHASIITGGAD